MGQGPCARKPGPIISATSGCACAHHRPFADHDQTGVDELRDLPDDLNSLGNTGRGAPEFVDRSRVDCLFPDRRVLAGLLYIDPADPGVFLPIERVASAGQGGWGARTPYTSYDDS